MLAPKAIEWAQRQESKIFTLGIALEEEGLALARRVGVKHPERIRLSLVPEMPFPTDLSLSDAGRRIGLLGPNRPMQNAEKPRQPVPSLFDFS